MDPNEMLENLIAAVLHAAATDGMPTDLKSLTFDFTDTGVKITATPSDGSAAYEGEMDSEQIAAALDADAAEPGGDAETADAPAEGEKAST